MKSRSKFNLSFWHMFSGKMGYLIPVGLTELLPGDSIQLSISSLTRLAPMVSPVMHPVHQTFQSFFIPTRVIWPDSEDFITGGSDGLDATVPPTVTITPAASDLANYLGLPIGHEIKVSALPFRAYNMVWNEYYRDQDLQSELPNSDGSGPDTTSNTTLQRVCWSKDYFTTARPWPQKGPGVTVPVEGTSGSFDIVPDPADPFPRFQYGWSETNGVPHHSTNQAFYTDAQNVAAGSATIKTSLGFPTPAVNVTVPYQGLAWSSSGLKIGADVGLGTIDINLLRQAFALQRFEEKRALFGSRYEDYLRTLGVRPQDARLQMPEYLGGSTRTIQFSEVLQTGGDVIGQLFGHGIAALGSGRIRYFVPEHGYLMTLMFVRPIPVYTQGIERHWLRETKEDYWQPGFEHIGQQQVLRREVYADGTDGDKTPFGWQNRYDEYRHGTNRVSGEMLTNQTYWHMGRMFSGPPALNSDFVNCHPTDRIFQATEQAADQLLCMVQNRLIARRLVSKNGNPI